MANEQSIERHNGVLMSLHWIIFVLFTIMYVLGVGLWKSDGYTALGAQWGPVFDWHATLGLIVLVLAIMRIIWRAKVPLPSWAPGLSERERTLTHWTEQFLYFIMIAKPVSGYILSGRAGYNIDLFVSIRLGNPFGTSLINNDGALYDVSLLVHILADFGFAAVFVFHVGQAVRHQFIKKDRLLERMLPGRA